MFSAKKHPVVPNTLGAKKKYDGADVIQQLRIDFNKKCYICGDKTNKDLRIEHFTPHLGVDTLKFDWNNLFLSCDYCNGIKSDTYNVNGKTLINSILENPEDYIGHKTSAFPMLDVSFEEKKKGVATNYTIELLQKIFNGKPNSSEAQITKREDLLKNLRMEMGDFLITLHKYLTIASGKEKEYNKAKLIDHLCDISNFLEFKRDYLITNIRNIKNLEGELGIKL